MLFLKAFPCFLAPFIFGEVPLYLDPILALKAPSKLNSSVMTRGQEGEAKGLREEMLGELKGDESQVRWVEISVEMFRADTDPGKEETVGSEYVGEDLKVGENVGRESRMPGEKWQKKSGVVFQSGYQDGADGSDVKIKAGVTEEKKKQSAMPL